MIPQIASPVAVCATQKSRESAPLATGRGRSTWPLMRVYRPAVNRNPAFSRPHISALPGGQALCLTHGLDCRITLPVHTEYLCDEQAFEHQTFFTRLHQFLLMSDAYIVAPGGIGTVLESMMIWQLLQVRHLRETPLIFAGPMWKGMVDWASAQMLRPGFELANPEDMQIPHCVDNAEQAIAIVRDHHARWQAVQGQTDGPASGKG